MNTYIYRHDRWTYCNKYFDGAIIRVQTTNDAFLKKEDTNTKDGPHVM